MLRKYSSSCGLLQAYAALCESRELALESILERSGMSGLACCN